MSQKILKFEDIEIEKRTFYSYKRRAALRDVDIEKVLVSNKICLAKKKFQYFIDYLVIKLSHCIYSFLKTSACVKSYVGQTKWMYFLIEEDDLFGKCNTFWGKVRADVKKEFDNEPVYNNFFKKIKMKSHGDEVTGYYDKEIPKEDSNHTCLAVVS